ncbi:DMT family transporter [Sinorhizobium sp. BG8]|uniref:DMT family transporter n=1 Tax=Sinorhizobium sp. BG8 TaxID=2613773 RepID=UPI00193CE293|nr:DMT family transporter [Sinorhizobium sp. BG8]QRM57278.1 DMT family transporter [Sinorhizobium sp. BG8]
MTQSPAIAQSQPENRLALAAILLGGVAISGSPIFVRLSEVGPIATAFWRVSLALLPLLLFAGFRRGKSGNPIQPQSLADCAILAVPGIMLALNLATWHLSLHITSVANSTLLANLAPVFVTIFGRMLFNFPITRTFLAGLAIAAVGIVVLKGGPAAIGGGNLFGDAVAIFAAMLYAGYILSVGRLRNRYNTLQIMIWGSIAAALCLLPMALIFEPVLLPSSAYGWSVVFGLAFASHASGQVLITYALAYLPAAFSSLTLLLQPVIASLLAWVVLNEPIGIMQGIGGIIVLAGILTARRG